MECINLNSTIVDYQSVDQPFLSNVTLILDMKNDTNKKIICVEKTQFHPISYQWPDQPGDKGLMLINDVQYIVSNSIIVAFQKPNGEIYIDTDIPVKMHEKNWVFLVGHIIIDDKRTLNTNIIGTQAMLLPDKELRLSLSTVHSACHLASLALNKVTAQYWKKEVEKDSLSNPNIDAITISGSTIDKCTSQDTFRFSKSARKKGLNTDSIIHDINVIERNINIQLNQWLQNKIDISLLPVEPSALCDRREWQCLLPDGLARIPCGGTHLMNFNAVKAITVSLKMSEDNVSMLMKTSVETYGDPT